MKKPVNVKSAIKGLRNYLRNSAGNATMIVGLTAIPLVASAGMAIDYVRGIRAAGELQQVTDAAALAAASAKNVSGSTASAKLAARQVIAEAYLDQQLPQVQDITYEDPLVTVGPNTVDIEVNATVKGSLINVLNGLASSAEISNSDLEGGGSTSNDIELSISSKIGYSKESYLCLLAMDPSSAEAIYFQGNSEFMATCAVQANSNHLTKAIKTWGNAYAEAESFCARGGWEGSGWSPAPEGGCTAKEDPYAGLTLPSAGSCITAATIPQAEVHATKGVTVKNTTATLKPGTYCKGLHISVGGVANLQPGLYIISGGKLDVDSQSRLNAPSGVVFYLTGSNAIVDIKSGATVTVQAPNTATKISTTEAYVGMAFMHDRTTNVGGENSIYSKGGVNIEGGFYAPKQNLVVWANGDMNADSDYFPMIVNKLNMNGTSTLFVDIDWDSGGFPEPTQLKTLAKVQVTQ